MTAFALQVEYSVGTDAGMSPQSLAIAFERAGAEIRDFSTHVFPRLTPVFEEEMAAQFGSEGRGPVAGNWAELSTDYREWKDAHHPGKTKLVLSGELRAALTSTTSKSKRTMSGDTFDFGTTGIEYASFHQTGTRWMPARPPFDFGAEFERKLKKAAQRGIVDAVRAAKLEATETSDAGPQ